MKTLTKSNVLITAVVLIFNLKIAIAQAPSIQWQRALGGLGIHDYAYSILQTNDGGYIVAGTSNTNNDGDVSGNHGNDDYWIVKLDTARNIQWQKSLGGSNEDRTSDIKQTSDKGYIVSGYTRSADGDVSGSHGASDDYWIVKLDSSGSLQWQKCLGGTGQDGATWVEQTIDGGFIVAGFSNSTNGDVTGNHGGFDTWIVKLSNAGVIQWQKCLGGTADDYYSYLSRTPVIKQMADGSYIVATTTSSVNGDVTGNHGAGDCWIVKLDASGIILWQKCFGGTLGEGAKSIALTADNGYIIGCTSSSNDGNVTGNHGGGDYWILKLDNSGSLQWQKSFGGSFGDELNSIQQITDGGYICAGWSRSGNGDVTGHHGSPGSSASSDYWIVRLNSSGNLVWQESLGGTGVDAANAVIQISDSGFLIAGTSGSFDGDVVGIHYPTSDYWIVKLTGTCNLPTQASSISTQGGIAKVCPGDTRTYSTPNTSGVTYYWTVPTGAVINSGQGTRNINVTYNNSFTADGIITVAKINGCGNGPARNLTIKRNVPSTPSSITGDNYGLCGASGKVFTVTNVSGMTYGWTVPAGATFTGQGTNSITAGFPSTNFTGTISVKASNACGEGVARNLNVKAVPSTPLSITGSTTACANQQNVAFSTAAVATATSYYWTVPSGSLITSGQGTNSIVMKYGTASGNVKVRATNGCGNSSYRNLAVTINCREGMTENNFDLSVYPNPGKDYFTLQLISAEEESFSIIVRDVIGKIVEEHVNVLTNVPFRFGERLFNGMYLLEVFNPDERKILRLVKE